MPTPRLPEEGILWRGWSDETLKAIDEKGRPVLLFVADPDPLVWPFLREIFKEMPTNARLRALLHDFYPALYIEANALPNLLRELGAGSRYHIAILSPHGLTPMITIDVVSGKPAGGRRNRCSARAPSRGVAFLNGLGAYICDTPFGSSQIIQVASS